MSTVWGMKSASYPDFADKLMPFLKSFCDRSFGRFSMEELTGRIQEAEAQVWIIDDFKAVAMTSVGPDYVSMEFCSGEDRDSWQFDLEAEIARWATHMGKKRLFIIGRPGWSKPAKKLGYREIHREMVREI